MYENCTNRVREVMQLANQEAKRLNRPYIATEHILLGLAGEGSGVATNVLRGHGIDWHKVRREVEKLVKYGPDEVTRGMLPQTPRAKKVMEYAIQEARNLKDNNVGTEHLLLGLLLEQEGLAAQLLMNLGLKLEDVRKEVLDLLGMIRGWRARHLPDPSWLSWQGGTVPKLARSIYEDFAFDRLSILADALEEAGCQEADLLDHLRGPGPYVRGCYVLDLLLGKS
jgi:ATP-dependent Clp protease ATP-binding subunit ClpA